MIFVSIMKVDDPSRWLRFSLALSHAHGEVKVMNMHALKIDFIMRNVEISPLLSLYIHVIRFFQSFVNSHISILYIFF